MPDMRITDIKVGEAMSREFGSVSRDTTLEEVINSMLANQWEEVVVVDQRHELVGLATREHLVRALSEGVPQNRPIAMTSVPTSLPSTTVPLAFLCVIMMPKLLPDTRLHAPVHAPPGVTPVVPPMWVPAPP